MARTLLNAFTSGALSPLTVGLVNLEGTTKGCRILENFQVLPSGGVVRRPGLLHRQMTHGDRPILIAFNYSATDAFRIEVGDGYFRVLREDGSLVVTPTPPPVGAVSSAGQPLRYSAPWTGAQLSKLQWIQANNLLLILHPDVHPMQLLRGSDTDWRLSEVTWDFPPMRDLNVSATTMTCSVTAVGATGTMTASAATFNLGHVGSIWEVDHVRSVLNEKLTFPTTLTAGVTSTPMRVIGTWEVFTVGNWDGTLYLEQEISAGVWEIVRTWDSENDYNAQTSGRVENETIMRLRFVGIGSAASGSVPKSRGQLSAVDPVVKGLVKITGYTSATVVNITVVRTIHDTSATSRWSEAAFSTYRGFPRAACFHDQRWLLGGVRSLPLTVFGSVTADIFNFERTGLEDGSFTYELAATESSPIAWIFSQSRGLIVATESEEWLMQGSEGKPITATSIEAQRKTSYGSDPQRVVLAGGSVIYVQTGAFALREYVFDFATQNFVSPDILELADHLVQSGIKCVAYSKKPIPTLHVVTNDGRLLLCTYRRAEGGTMVAWSEVITDGGVDWVSVLYNEGESDSVALVVTRNGASRIEEFSPNHLRSIKDAITPETLVHLDAAVVQTGVATTTMPGLEHLEGQEVCLLIDGAEYPKQLVPVGGVLTLPVAAETVVAGLPYTSKIQPMPWDLGMEDGTSAGRKTKAGSLSILFYQSGNCRYQDSPASKLYDVVFRQAQDSMDAPVPLFSGWKKVTLSASYRDTFDAILSTSGPLPLNILAMSPTQQVYGA
jgi:hypothetical protein